MWCKIGVSWVGGKLGVGNPQRKLQKLSSLTHWNVLLSLAISHSLLLSIKLRDSLLSLHRILS
jgi:hypothetical protein